MLEENSVFTSIYTIPNRDASGSVVRTVSIERVKGIRKGMFDNTVFLIAEAALYNTARVRVKITYRNYKLSISYPTVQHKH